MEISTISSFFYKYDSTKNKNQFTFSVFYMVFHYLKVVQTERCTHKNIANNVTRHIQSDSLHQCALFGGANANAQAERKSDCRNSSNF